MAGYLPAIIVLCLSFVLACPVLLETVVGAVIFSGPAGPDCARHYVGELVVPVAFAPAAAVCFAPARVVAEPGDAV